MSDSRVSDADRTGPERTVEARVRAQYDHVEPAPQLRDDVLASLDEQEPASRAPRIWPVAALAAAAAVLIAFLVGTPRPRDDERPVVGGEPETPVEAPRDDVVAAARAVNERAYASMKADLHAKYKGKWVVISGGALTQVAARFEDVGVVDALTVHRFVFQVGTEGDTETFVSQWYAPRFGGPPLAKALDVDWQSGAGGFVLWREGGPRVKAFTPGPFPRVKLRIGASAGEMKPLELFPGSVGPALVLTKHDYDRMGLARYEVPGTHKVGWIDCTRVLVRVSLAEGDRVVPVVAAVSREPEEKMRTLARERHRFWTWGGNLAQMATAGHDGKWLLFANDRVLGVGDTLEAALRAGETATDFAYQRFLVKLPRGPMTDGALERPETTTLLAADGRLTVDQATRVRATIAGVERTVTVVTSAQAEALDAHLAELPDLLSYEHPDGGRRSLRLGVVSAPDGLAVVGVPVAPPPAPPQVPTLPSAVDKHVAGVAWEDLPLADVALYLQLVTGQRIVVVRGDDAGKIDGVRITLSADQATVRTLLDLITEPHGLVWDEQDGAVRIGTKAALGKE